jgi:hypothetical protein
MKRAPKVGTVRKERFPVFDSQGRMRGTVGRRATAVTASRFTNEPNAKLVKKDGRMCWSCEKSE